MSANIARYRNITLTQGGADAFVQSEEITGIDPTTGRAWQLERLELHIPQATALQGVSADFSITTSLSRDTKTAVAEVNDNDCLATMSLFGALTTSGQIVIASPLIYTFQPGVLVVEPELFMQLDSAATGLTLTAYARLYYSEVKLSEVDILRMLTQG